MTSQKTILFCIYILSTKCFTAGSNELPVPIKKALIKMPTQILNHLQQDQSSAATTLHQTIKDDVRDIRNTIMFSRFSSKYPDTSKETVSQMIEDLSFYTFQSLCTVESSLNKIPCWNKAARQSIITDKLVFPFCSCSLENRIDHLMEGIKQLERKVNRHTFDDDARRYPEEYVLMRLGLFAYFGIWAAGYGTYQYLYNNGI